VDSEDDEHHNHHDHHHIINIAAVYIEGINK